MPASGFYPPELRVQILTLYAIGLRTNIIATYL